MAHSIQALIASEDDAGRIRRGFEGAVTAKAGAARWVVPMGASFGDIVEGVRAMDLEHVTPEEVLWAVSSLVDALGRLALRAPVVIAMTEYFGGAGGQAALVVQQDSAIEGPFVGNDAINRALRIAGVRAGDARDEFEAVGLHRWRANADIGAADERAH